MPIELPSDRLSPLYPIAAIVLATAIFVIDTLTPLGIAIAVLYALVVMLSANFLDRRGVLVVAAICVVFTVVSFLAGHLLTLERDAIIRCAISLCAIGLTTFLALKNLDALLDLKKQAAMLALTHDAIFVSDPSGTISYWNRGAEALYGWSAEEAIGRRANDLLAAPDPGPTGPQPGEIEREGRWEGELRRRTKAGAIVTVMSRWSLNRDGRGEAAAIMETSNDITGRIAAEDALAHARAELAHMARVTTLGELTASIAHEVNQPLAAVVTNGEAGLRWLSREPPNLEAVRASLEKAIANGRRASDVVARLRALARRAEPEHQPLDLNALVAETLPLLEREIASRGVALDLDLDTATPVIVGDRVQLQQVLINLVMNAVQAMEALPADATRRLALRSAAYMGPAGPQALLAVDDTGAGLGGVDAATLFAAFYTTRREGMGMGLSICRSIVEAHGGQIGASDNAAGGASFILYLPANLGEDA